MLAKQDVLDWDRSVLRVLESEGFNLLGSQASPLYGALSALGKGVDCLPLVKLLCNYTNRRYAVTVRIFSGAAGCW